eukprot:gene3535-4560_t
MPPRLASVLPLLSAARCGAQQCVGAEWRPASSIGDVQVTASSYYDDGVHLRAGFRNSAHAECDANANWDFSGFSFEFTEGDHVIPARMDNEASAIR